MHSHLRDWSPQHSNMASDGTHIPVLDVRAVRNKYFIPPPSTLRPLLARLLLKDTRDAPLLYMLANAAAFTLPFAYIVFRTQSHALGFVYWISNTLLFQERFILGMHYLAHRRLFRIPGLDSTIAFFASPFFGLHNVGGGLGLFLLLLLRGWVGV